MSYPWCALFLYCLLFCDCAPREKMKESCLQQELLRKFEFQHQMPQHDDPGYDCHKAAGAVVAGQASVPGKMRPQHEQKHCGRSRVSLEGADGSIFIMSRSAIIHRGSVRPFAFPAALFFPLLPLSQVFAECGRLGLEMGTRINSNSIAATGNKCGLYVNGLIGMVGFMASIWVVKVCLHNGFCVIEGDNSPGGARRSTDGCGGSYAAGDLSEA
eukprot:g7479.t1